MDIFSLIALAKAKGSGGSGGGGGSENAVTYTAQSLTTNQKAQARENIGAGTFTKPSDGIPSTDLSTTVQQAIISAQNAVSYYEHQIISEAGKTCARENIDAASISSLDNYATASALGSVSSELTTLTSVVSEKMDKPKITTYSGLGPYMLKANETYILTDTAASDMSTIMIGLRPSGDAYDEYHFIFSTGDSAPTFTIASDIVLPDGWNIKANTYYEFNIFNDHAVVGSWEISEEK